MTCKDCIGGKYCNPQPNNPRNVEKWCGKFKNKADFVEVVRCKDCKNSIRTHAILHEKLCLVHRVSVSEGYFCASGERRDT